MAVALLVAGGRGERLGSQTPKALIELAGRPMLAWSLDALRASAGIEEIVIALPDGVALPDELRAGAGDAVPVKVVGGGSERSHSVRNALQSAKEAAAVLVHDAARPLVTVELIDECLRALDADGSWDAAIAAAPVTDTIKRAPGGGSIEETLVRRVEETLVRSDLWAVQTPQVFRRAALVRALSRPDAELAEATDDATLVERDGGSVRVVRAPQENIKVTRPVDLELAALLLSERR
jgi:2-C-methyl-D-erythritol 4-phosphate cytidylyltransferase